MGSLLDKSILATIVVDCCLCVDSLLCDSLGRLLFGPWRPGQLYVDGSVLDDSIWFFLTFYAVLSQN